MDPRRFDGFARRLASRRLSRRTVSAAGAGLVAAAVSRAGAANGQASPAATPASAAGMEMAANNATLFVQTAAAGTFKPNPQAGTMASPAATPVVAAQGAYVLKLTGHAGQTIAFSDRPQRQFGEVKTAQFFASMGFTPANPPNAALVADSAQQENDVLLIELFNPAYDAASQTLTYQVNILQRYQGELLAPLAAEQQDRTIAEEFTTASLFIDDCSDLTDCFQPDLTRTEPDYVGPLPGGPVGRCWHWKTLSCRPCNGESQDYYDGVCDNAYSQCGGGCFAS